MDVKQRAMTGALSGLLATFVLSALRVSLNKLGLIYTTAPEQVVRRVDETGLLGDLSPSAKTVLMVAAHFGYGTAAGATFGALRTEAADPSGDVASQHRGEREDALSEAAVGAALGILSWGAGWAGWLPIAGVHPAPWSQRTPRALLPVLDHAAFGAAWGLVYRILSRERGS